MSLWPMRVGVLLLAVAGVAACGGDPAETPTGATAAPVAPTTAVASSMPAAEPRTVEAAQAAAEAELDAYAAGDWAGAWDLWSAEGQAAISRED